MKYSMGSQSIKFQELGKGEYDMCTTPTITSGLIPIDGNLALIYIAYINVHLSYDNIGCFHKTPIMKN